MMDALVVTDSRVVKVLLSEQAGTYLQAYMESDRSIAEVAEQVGRTVQRTHYWTKRLQEVGLIEVCNVVHRAGRPIRTYRSVAGEFIVRAEALPAGVFEAQMLEVHRALTRAFERSYPDLVHDGDLRIHRTGRGATGISYDRGPRAGMPLPEDAVQSSFTVRLSTDEAHQLRDELAALRDKWLEIGTGCGSHRKTYLSVIAIAPLLDENSDS